MSGQEVRAKAAWAAIFVLCAFAPLSVAAADLTVTVGGLRNYRGSVWLYLWRDSADTAKFPVTDKVQHRDERNDVPVCDFPRVSVCRRGFHSLQELTATYTFEDIVEGDYAVAALHDENNNGLMDTGLFRRPLEGRGFSGVLPQDVGHFTRVFFRRARFYFKDSQKITIGLRYPPRFN